MEFADVRELETILNYSKIKGKRPNLLHFASVEDLAKGTVEVNEIFKYSPYRSRFNLFFI